MKATLTIITIPTASLNQSQGRKEHQTTDNQVVLEQLPGLVRRIHSGLANSSDAEWVDHTVSGLVERIRQSNRQTDHLEMTLCHSALKFEPPRRINQSGHDVTLFPAKWNQSDTWTVPGVGHA